MQTHSDLVPKNASIVTKEQLTEVSLYCQKLCVFEKATHIQVSWDPSTYDVETLVSVIYSHELDMSAFLPIQNIQPVLQKELSEELRALASVGKVTRIEGFNELRALSHSLKAINKPLQHFMLPEDLHIQPLLAEEGGAEWPIFH